MKSTKMRRVEELAKKLTKAAKKYYDGEDGFVSDLTDDEFDKLKEELETLDPSHPF